MRLVRDARERHAALDLPYDRFCFACFDGNYPVPVPYDASARKFMLEAPVPTPVEAVGQGVTG